jgi:hypothetical protein
MAADLSLRLARQHFGETELVTDSAGRDLAARFSLPFDNVRTDLDRIGHVDPRLWCYGKLEAYRLQEEPFIHLDFDVFMKLPVDLGERFAGKALVFQEWEFAAGSAGQYARAVRACQVLGCRSFPAWKSQSRAGVAGVVAGLDPPALRPWFDAARDWVENPDNAPFWGRALRGDTFKFVIAAEQYLPVEVLGQDRVGVLLDGPGEAQQLGFVHYAGGMKRDPQIEKKIRDHWRRPREYRPPGGPATGPPFGDLDDC